MKNILEYLEHTAENHPDKIGFTDEQRDVTFSELMQNAQRIAGSLARIGCRKPVAVLIDRNVRCIEAMFAAVYAGNFYVVIDVQSPETRVHSILETLHPAAIITDNEWLPLVVRDSLQGVDIGFQYPAFFQKLLTNPRLRRLFLSEIERAATAN